MPYATSDDIVALYGLDQLVRVSDLDRDGQVDPDVVEAGLQAADDEINLYLSALYTVPVPFVSGGLRRIAVDVALYRMALNVTSRTTEMRQRYEDAIGILKMMAKGDVGLGAPPTDTDGDGTPETDPNIRRKARIFDIGRG